MFDGMIAVGLGVYLLSLAISWWVLAARLPAHARSFTELGMPIGFLGVVALYVLPLSIRSMVTRSIEGDISPQVGLFADYIPACLVMCAYFNLSFAYFYRAKTVLLKSSMRDVSMRALSFMELQAVLLLTVVSVWMLVQLGKPVGGLLNMILIGYRVTALFTESSHFAIAFDWLIALCIVLLFSAFISKSKIQLSLAVTMILILGTGFFIMGRRSSLVVLIGSALYAYHAAFKRLTLVQFSIVMLTAFLALNFIGLTRGESYHDLGSVADTMTKQADRLDDDSPGWFYALTTGNFAVPFETMPQIVRTMGHEYLPGFGIYSLRSCMLILPNFIAQFIPFDRPEGLANWYMDTYYGTVARNEGRQFFFLTEAFMNFGPLGMVIWGALTGWTIKAVSRLARYSGSDALAGAFVAAFIGSSLNFVSTDLFAFYVWFVKGIGFPLIILWASRKLFSRRRLVLS